MGVLPTVCLWTTCLPLDFLELELQMVVHCWEPNHCSLEEQPVPSIQPHFCLFLRQILPMNTEQASFQLNILLPLSHECWDIGVHHHFWLCTHTSLCSKRASVSCDALVLQVHQYLCRWALHNYESALWQHSVWPTSSILIGPVVLGMPFITNKQKV